MKSPLYQYDRAVFDLIHSLYDEVYFCSPEEVMSRNAKKHSGKVLLPFIAVWRLPDFSLNLDMANDSFLRRGYRVTSSDGRIEHPNQRVTMHGLPVTLSYNIDVYATKRDVCDGITSELLMYLCPRQKVRPDRLCFRLLRFRLYRLQAITRFGLFQPCPFRS